MGSPCLCRPILSVAVRRPCTISVTMSESGDNREFQIASNDDNRLNTHDVRVCAGS
jgi:hypothetical protein